ncbi:ATP-dependent nuclease [Alienimonas californiensis]|uniref:Uncharacterized protein n=1 Tax=Alienimonas californiensis TaxID=2527989 RepID=A0A517PAS9_9PLAN|nr:AAA family ATPase [Alienimonas californiensis]QDT16461.1 hypothetical protein CA12_25640 [Alienimonas californiensis]
MQHLGKLNPLTSISIPNIGKIEPKGLNVVIGPNSAGKTQFLKDIHYRMLGKPRDLVVCEEISLTRKGTLPEIIAALEEAEHIRVVPGSNSNHNISCRVFEFGGSSDRWQADSNLAQLYYTRMGTSTNGRKGGKDEFLSMFGRSFIASLFLGGRLNSLNEVPSFDYEKTTPEKEIQALYLNEDAQHALTAETERTFGRSIWVDPTRGGVLCLRVGDGPALPPDADRTQPSRMTKFRTIENEGDGFKSYVAICISLLLGQRPVILIDEPELCLHPPQAHSLGKFIGRYGTSDAGTTFVATHSSHVLRGIIEETEYLDVIRLSRAGTNFSGQRIESELLRASIRKPSTKSEAILDGLFAEAVTVVEGEGDRLVYGTVWEKVSAEFKHDVHFVSVGGMGGAADPCELYARLRIPICVIVDLDIIRSPDIFKSIVSALAPGPVAEDLTKDCRKLVEEVKALGPVYDEAAVRSGLTSILSAKLDWTDETQLNQTRRTLGDLSAGLSQTSRLKKGLEEFHSYGVYSNLTAFLSKCRGAGVFLVPVGELEDWAEMLTSGGPSKKKKAEWANHIANAIRDSDPREDDIWEFIRQMARRQRNEIERLAGY